MPQATQKNREIQIATPLGEDVLLFYRMAGQEHLSQLFEYEVELLSESSDIKPEQLLGENVTIGLMLPDDKIRYFNGYITRFGYFGALDEFAYYRASIRPWLWFFSRTANCRIFQNQNTIDIVKQICSDQGFSGEIKDNTSSSYNPREYCVQYRETDFNFISRLLEDEGIYYYFSHESGKHQLVLTDAVASETYPGYPEIPFHQEAGTIDHTRIDHIHHWSFAKEVQSGKFTSTDFDPEKPKSDLAAISNNPNSHPHAGYEIFDYPGGYKEVGLGESMVKIRREEHQTRFERCEGAGNARGLATGYTFKMLKHPMDNQNTDYLIVSAKYRMEINGYFSRDSSQGDRVFDCTFTAMSNNAVYRPARITPKPLIYGAQTAIVTGPAGEEIHTDKYGRVKVQFHWDRYAQADENSSCWVRVSHPWAGKGWGMIALPRIGQEVIVDFMEGNPDRPIITGRVYNGESMPPYPLPSKAHLSTIKTNSTKGGGGFNELRFDDSKGKEQIFIHAQNNQDVRVENDHFEWIGNERHLIVKKDQLEQIDGDQHSTVKGDSNQQVKGTLSIKADMDMQEKVGMKHALDAGQEIHLKAGMNVIIEAGLTLTIKAGSNFIAMTPAGVAISGALVNINSGGAAGSGSGSSPDTPKLPKEADKDKEGKSDEPPKAAKPPKPTVYGPSATVLKAAAESGTPFCEQCAAAAAAAGH